MIGLLLNPNLSEQDIKQLLDNQRARDEKRDQEEAERVASINQQLADEEDGWRRMWREGRKDEVVQLRTARDAMLAAKRKMEMDFFFNVEWPMLVMRMFG